jgi:hypothetical protein
VGRRAPALACSAYVDATSEPTEEFVAESPERLFGGRLMHVAGPRAAGGGLSAFLRQPHGPRNT